MIIYQIICISCYQENKITKEEFKKQYLEIKKKDQNHGLFVIAENKSESKEEFTTKKKDKKAQNNDQNALILEFPPGSKIFTITRDALFGIDPTDFSIFETIQLTRFRKLNPNSNLQFAIYLSALLSM